MKGTGRDNEILKDVAHLPSVPEKYIYQPRSETVSMVILSLVALIRSGADRRRGQAAATLVLIAVCQSVGLELKI